MFVDPETGKLMMRTKSGRVHEVSSDVNVFTDPNTGRTYVRTKSGRYLELDPDAEIEIDPLTGKMFIRTKSGNRRELAGEMEVRKTYLQRCVKGFYIQFMNEILHELIFKENK